MIQLEFIRPTHDGNGCCRAFPPEAWQFWWDHDALGGDVLGAESPLALAEIVTDSREHALEYPGSDSYSILTEEYVAWCLLKLCGVGIAAAVIETESANVALH